MYMYVYDKIKLYKVIKLHIITHNTLHIILVIIEFICEN